MSLLLLNGHVACLKTTLAYSLSPGLGMALVSTSVLGEFPFDDKDAGFLPARDRRYAIAAETISQYLSHGISVIADGTYALGRWRRRLYETARNHGVDEIVALTCTCSDPNVVRRRLLHRRLNPDAPDAASHDFAAFDSSIASFEPLDEDQALVGSGLVRLTFDSATFTIDDAPSDYGLASRVVDAVRGLATSGFLSRPLFISATSPPVPRQRLFVAIEGIGGSGKTTQSERIGQILRDEGRVGSVRVYPEFSSTTLGGFLRNHVQNSTDFRARCREAAGHSHLESLLIIGDLAHRAQHAANSNVCVSVFDGFVISQIAHAVASLQTGDRLLRDHVTEAIRAATSPGRNLPGRLATRILRIPPEIAADRLSARMGRALGQDETKFLRRLATAYQSIRHEGDVQVIDGTRSEYDVTRALIKSLQLPL